MKQTVNWQAIEALLEELIDHHRTGLLRLGKRFVPGLTSEDILQPNDFPQLENHPEFRYEEGVLAGLLTAQTAIRSLRL